MRKILLHTFLLLVSAGFISAQTPDRLVAEIRSAAEDACVTVDYALTATVDGNRIEDRGTVVAQDDLWCLKGRMLEIYTCADGTWIMHVSSKEAMIEPKWTYDDLEAFYRTLLSSDADIDVKADSKSLSEKKPVSWFVPEPGQDWVVTDLR